MSSWRPQAIGSICISVVQIADIACKGINIFALTRTDELNQTKVRTRENEKTYGAITLLPRE